MAEYVQYHNTDKQGQQPRVDRQKLRIYWTGNRSLPEDVRVWLVAGETVDGRKKYFLAYRFIVDEVGTDDDGMRFASGVKGRVFQPPVEITHEPWFPNFLHYMGNFGRGLSQLSDEYISCFEEATGNLPELGDFRQGKPTAVVEESVASVGAGFTFRP